MIIFHAPWRLDFRIYNLPTHWNDVEMSRGWPKKAGTASSMREWTLTKLTVTSGRVEESGTHWPGRGSGTWREEKRFVVLDKGKNLKDPKLNNKN